MMKTTYRKCKITTNVCVVFSSFYAKLETEFTLVPTFVSLIII